MVVDDPTIALELAAGGHDVVLVLPATGAVPASPGPGRIAVMVGDGTDPAVRAAAQEMDSELFGARG